MANSELRELLDRAARKLDLPFDNEEPIDITERFFEDCSQLTLGEVIRYDSFSLGEAMSAVELMDEKMDIGMKKVTRKMGLDESIAQGLYESSIAEQLITYDATLCAFVTWLEGSCIGQTLWTNVLLADPARVRFHDHPVFACLSHGFYHIVMLVKSIIQNASVYEEEDFNPHLPYPCSSQYSMHEVIQFMKETELSLVKRSDDPTKSEDRARLLSLSSRIAFLRLFLIAIAYMVPPRRTDISLDSDPTQMPALDAVGFTADLDAAAGVASKLMLLSSKFLETSLNETAPRPDGVDRDGDFSWLVAFEPELNRRYLPSTFPRKIEILPREKALPHLHRISCKIHYMASQVRNNLADSTSLVEFMKWFSYDDSCVLTRSILQMVVYPLDDNVLGTQPTALLVERSLKNTVLPLALIPNTPLYDHEECRKAVEDFTMNATRVMLSLYQNFGFNLARQRDKLVLILEDMNELHEDACRADSICREIVPLHNKYNPFVTFVFTQTLALVVYHIELSFRLDLFAPFEYTYMYWFYGEVVGRWYMTSIEKTREIMRDTLNKESELHEQGRKNKRKARSRLQHEEHFRIRSAIWQNQLILRYGHSAMADATFHVAVALIKIGQIRVPMWDKDSERLRFEHRMAFLSSVGEPLHVSYEEFLLRSRVRELIDGDIEIPLQRAIDTFELARSQFEKLTERPEFTVHVKPLILVCRTNVIVARLLLAGNVRDRRVTWHFMPDSPLFPILKLVTEK